MFEDTVTQAHFTPPDPSWVFLRAIHLIECDKVIRNEVLSVPRCRILQGRRVGLRSHPVHRRSCAVKSRCKKTATSFPARILVHRHDNPRPPLPPTLRSHSGCLWYKRLHAVPAASQSSTPGESPICSHQSPQHTHTRPRNTTISRLQRSRSVLSVREPAQTSTSHCPLLELLSAFVEKKLNETLQHCTTPHCVSRSINTAL